MKLLILAAFVAVCSAANLNRNYLPPSSAENAGGSPGALQTPFNQKSNQVNQYNQGNQATQYNQGNQATPNNQGNQATPNNQGNQATLNNQPTGNQAVEGVPSGAYNNEFQGVVVDADPGTRTNEFETGLGAPRPSYGSQNSKVGEAAFTAPVQQRFSHPTVAPQRQQFVVQQQQTFVPQNQQTFVHHQQQNFAPQQQSFIPQQQQSFIPQQSFNQQQQSFAQQQQAFIPQQQNFVPQPSVATQQIQVRPNAEQDRRANIVRYENEIEAEKYRFAFETDNGITHEQSGNTVNGNRAQGAFGYIGDDGENYQVTYTADERGYRPQGKHLPTSPPIPDIILKAIEQNARDEAAGIRDDGSYDAQRYNAGSEYNATPSNVESVNAQSSSSSSSSSQNNARPQQIVQEPFNNEFSQQQNFGQQQAAQPSRPQSYLPPVTQQYNQVRPVQVPSQQVISTPLSNDQPSSAPVEINIINRFTSEDSEVEPESQQFEQIQPFNTHATESVQQAQSTAEPIIQYNNRQQQQSVNQISQFRPAVQNNLVAQRPANNNIISYNYNRPQQSFSAQNFQSPQGQVQYPRPAIATPTIIPVQQISVPMFQNQQYNGITQAAASQFSRPAQSTQLNIRPQVQHVAPQQFNKAPVRPIVHQQIQGQPQINSSRPAQAPNQFKQNNFQNFGQRQQVNQQFQVQATQEQAGQQYNGEIYEYNKPAPVLSTPEPAPQISKPVPTQVPVQDQVTARPQINQQFGQASQFGQNQQSFVAQPQQVNNQFAAQEEQVEGQNQNHNGAQNSGTQFQGVSNPLASQTFNDNFGGARQPPSFNENTGYQY